jgi:hypothetical protein
MSLILSFYVIISIIIGGYPFVLALTVTYDGAKRISPTQYNETVTIGWILHLLTLFIGMFGLIFSILAYKFKKSMIIEHGYTLEKFTVLGVGIVLNITIFLIFYLGTIYLGNVQKNYRKCRDFIGAFD